MKTLVLGAGASAATLGDDRAPVSASFGKTLNHIIPAWKRDYPFLQSAIAYLQKQQSNVTEESWPLDAVWNGIDENYKLGGIIANNDFEWPSYIPSSKRLYRQYQSPSWRSFWILSGWELKRVLAKVYGTSLKEWLSNPIMSDKWLAKRLGELKEGDVVASTNYDLLAESIIRQRWPNASNCRTEQEYRLPTRSQAPVILKLHGSLDWLFRSNWITKRSQIDRTPDNKPITDDDIDLDEDFWETRPLVIAPVQYKDEIIFPSAQPPELVEVLQFQWGRLIDAVSRTDELQIFGYRFPPNDSYGNRLLQEAVRRRAAAHRLRVLLYLCDDECPKVKKRLERDLFWANEVQVECCEAIP